jgi:hypothetical protein
MIHFHKWEYNSDGTERDCLKCGRHEEEVWEDTFGIGYTPDFKKVDSPVIGKQLEEKK